MEIIVGTKKWSSWSMRPWLAIKHTGEPFEETLIRIHWQGAAEEIGQHSPSGLVPALKDGDLVVFDSLAVCEYLNEAYPAA
jgi:glutathione S-transferase